MCNEMCNEMRLFSLEPGEKRAIACSSYGFLKTSRQGKANAAFTSASCLISSLFGCCIKEGRNQNPSKDQNP